MRHKYPPSSDRLGVLLHCRQTERRMGRLGRTVAALCGGLRRLLGIGR
jgi:hypothetical protein